MALLDSGIVVWWDEDIQCGQAWNDVLDDAVKRASCIIVLWSRRAMQSRWVMHEASSAIDRGVYTPVRIELCTIDPPYNRLQATDIVEWDGRTHHPGFLDLLQRVNNLLPIRQSFPIRIAQWCRANLITLPRCSCLYRTWNLVLADNCNSFTNGPDGHSLLACRGRIQDIHQNG
ncbi:MAG: toll/interleukin-1 receptor domain-containing protein [Lewinellaceae bacterium]|nr:toll/interleukin-1 receptor domain-containing protein [Lewinellaceae bacterium]